MTNEITSEKNKVEIDNVKLNEVAKRISEMTDIPLEKSKSILGIGVANAIVLNRFRSAFKDKDDLKEE
jgi:hypothetical protein